MRIRIVQKPPVAHVDGIRLDHFVPGHEYDLGPSLCSLLLAEGWAEPVVTDEPGPEAAPVSRPVIDTPAAPANLVREFFPPYYEGPSVFATDRRRAPRRSSRRTR